MTDFDSVAFRRALGRFATGVTIVTTVDAEGQQYGVTANSYNSVSLDPPLVLWSLARSSRSIEAFESSGAFAIHILSADQEELAMRFASSAEDKFAGLDVHEGHGGVPLFDDCAAHFECETQERFDGGDHVIFLGRVVHFARGDHQPLVFHDGKFTRLGLPDVP
jgi:3-hydroxy-9,10-secoandrosta-1,3,5(10)-triene-9,17-dione monooxygenase reductase component